MRDGVDRDTAFPQGRRDGAADEPLLVAGLTGRGEEAERLGERADFTGEDGIGKTQLALTEGKDERIERDGMVHRDGDGLAGKEAARPAVEGQVDLARVDAVVVGLGVEDAVDPFGGMVLVGVAAQIDGELREFAGEGADLVGLIVATDEAPCGRRG